jgi:vacuolar protein sorting-associated protein 72
METEKEEQHVFLDRASRATRGKRMTKLVDDEAEEDDQFWNQDALKEEEDDNNYEEEKEVADVFDSDFDEDEQEPDEEVEKEPDDRARKTRKRLVYPGKPVSKKKKVVSKLDEKVQEQLQHNDGDNDDEVEVEEKIVRKSTRTSVVVRQAERDAIRVALQANIKPIIRRKVGEEKRMTQEEMLLEAAQTEIMNLRNLERVLAREEEVKKRAIVHKAVYSGPQIRYLSKNGCSYLEFTNGASFESEISATPTPYPEKTVCAVTGLPAKYRDPKTGLGYATKEAFWIIRERASDENKKSKQREDMDGSGTLCHLLSEHDHPKRKRDPRGRPDNYEYRFIPRLRTIPAFDRPLLVIDSD